MRLLLAFALLMMASAAQAAAVAGINLVPITVTLDAQRPADAITLSNGTLDPKVFQAEVMVWSRENGVDQFAPAKDMRVNPPMFRVAAGAKQVVRVGLKSRAAANSPTEKTYRLFLQEVPETAPVTSAEAGGTTLRLLMRFGIPIFVKPSTPQPESLHWKAQYRQDGSIALSVHNDGNRHVKVSEIQLESAGKSIGTDSFAYVFSGETYIWTLKPDQPIPAGDASVSARTDNGPVHAALALQP
jgi:fimbrial chaperone protein